MSLNEDKFYRNMTSKYSKLIVLATVQTSFRGIENNLVKTTTHISFGKFRGKPRGNLECGSAQACFHRFSLTTLILCLKHRTQTNTSIQKIN